MPKVSVIMASNNTPDIYLKESIDSILNQTFTDFEFIIINDGSESFDLLNLLGGKIDTRIRVITNKSSIGLTKSLNKGLAIAQGEYIVRMDADDRSEKNRIERQVAYMDSHQNVVAAGSWVRKFGDIVRDERYSIPDTIELQKIALFFGNLNIVHPSTIIRSSAIRNNDILYNEKYSKAQDYDLWTQLVQIGKIAIIPEFLMYYRVHNKQVSVEKKSEQNDCAAKIRFDQLKLLNIEPTEEQKEVHINFCLNKIFDSPSKTREWLDLIKNCNKVTKYYNPELFDEELEYRWFQICYQAWKVRKVETYEQPYVEVFTLRRYARMKKYSFKQLIIDRIQKLSKY